jgi:hypothetical protein
MILKGARCAEAKVVLAAGLIAVRGKAQGRCGTKGELVAQVDQLKDRLQRVIAIASPPSDMQKQIHLGAGIKG